MRKVFYRLILCGSIFTLTSCASLSNQVHSVNAALQGTDVIVQHQANQLILILPATISFKPGGTRLNPKAYSVLTKIADVIQKNYAHANIKVAGFTDNSGQQQRNNAISLIRARAVAGYLRYRGIPREQIDAIGFGDSKPIASNDTADGRAMNRRIEIYISG